MKIFLTNAKIFQTLIYIIYNFTIFKKLQSAFMKGSKFRLAARNDDGGICHRSLVDLVTLNSGRDLSNRLDSGHDARPSRRSSITHGRWVS